MSKEQSRLSVVPMVVLAITGLLFASQGISAAAPSAAQYTMVAFSNVSDRDLDVYQSTDGTQFDAIGLSAYRPATGLMRDPSVFKHTDGAYYITYTTGGTDIGFARSEDRINWTPMKSLPVPLCCFLLPGTGDGKGLLSGSAGFPDIPSLSPFTTKAWAPEWFVDGDRVNIIVSLSTGGGFVPYLLTAQDSSLSTWSMPVPLAGLGADRIDTTIVKVNSTYHAFTKNETHKFIEHAIAPSLTGPYTFVPPGDWGTLREGPALAELPNGDWRIYYDAYIEGKYFYSDSSDGLNTWSAPKELPGLSGSVRHVGVVREPA